jgi:predicted nucleic acid-binding Zn ribbon protein
LISSVVGRHLPSRQYLFCNGCGEKYENINHPQYPSLTYCPDCAKVLQYDEPEKECVLSNELRELIADPHVMVYRDSNGELYLVLESAQVVLAGSLPYVKELFLSIVRLKDEIARFFDVGQFHLIICGYTIDGYTQVDSVMIGEDSKLECVSWPAA